jgi:hypothetical protein
VIDSCLRIQLQLSEDDLARFLKYSLERHGTKQTSTWLVVGWIGIACAPLLPYLFTKNSIPFEAIAAGIMLMSYGVYSIRYTARHWQIASATYMRSIDARRYLQPMQIEVTPSGVRSTTAMADSWYAWSLVPEIDHSDDRTYIWIGHALVITIPHRAFENEHLREHFFESAERFRREYEGTRFDCPKCGYDLRSNARTGCPECGWGRDGETKH